jgi:predicted dehydrogenase
MVVTSHPEEVRRLYGLDVKTCGSYSDLVSDRTLDAVVVCTPTFLHEVHVLAAVNQGLHVICEKPFALDLTVAQRMLEGAHQNKVVLMIAQVLRFWPPYVRIKDAVDSGEIGTVQGITAYRLAKYPSWGDWFRDPQKSGGVLFDMQVHEVDFVYWLLSAPHEVYAAGVRSATGSWDHVCTTLRYPGAIVGIESSYLLPDSWPFSCGIRVLGSATSPEYNFRVVGNLEHRQQATSRLVIYQSNGSIEDPPVLTEDMYVAQLQYFVDCLEGGRAPLRCLPDDSYKVMEIMEACRESLSTSAPVRLATSSPPKLRRPRLYAEDF